MCSAQQHTLSPASRTSLSQCTWTCLPTRHLTHTQNLTPPARPSARTSKPQTDPAGLNRAIKWTWITGGALTLVLLILWPLLALPAGVFSKAYFTMWVVISLIWGLAALCVCLFMPWYESRRHVVKIFKGVLSGSVFKAKPARAADAGMAPPMTKG